MSGTPKQQDGNGSVSAGASLSPLEQTMLGVAPPPASSAPASPRALTSAPPLEAAVAPSLPSPGIAVAPVIAVCSTLPAPTPPTSAFEPSSPEPDEAPPPPAARDVTMDLPSSGDTRGSVASTFEPGSEHAPRGGSLAGGRGFEPVPVVRAPLAESLSSALGPLAELGGPRFPLPPPSRPRTAPARQREGVGRWLLLAAVALATVGIVSIGGRLWHRYRAQGSQQRLVASGASVASSSPLGASATPSSRALATHALLANRPAPAAGAHERVRVVSVTGAPSPAHEPGASASPESQLAATAGRHVLSGNYAEALPLYRQLERSFPENTSYAAMAKLLEKKVGSRNDTLTVTPAASSTP